MNSNLSVGVQFLYYQHVCVCLTRGTERILRKAGKKKKEFTVQMWLKISKLAAVRSSESDVNG